MNTHDKIKLPPHDATANISGSPPIRLYSEAKVRAAIEADRKVRQCECQRKTSAVIKAEREL